MRALGIVAAAWAALGCDTGGGACTEDLRAVFVTGIDSVGAPVANAAVSHVLPRTLTPVTIAQDPAQAALGRYVAFSDAALAQLDSTTFQAGGEVVRMTGIAGPTSFVADFVFAVPDGCHVRRVSGPDTVVFQ
jgi:hypothetical protein